MVGPRLSPSCLTFSSNYDVNDDDNDDNDDVDDEDYDDDNDDCDEENFFW